jgi:integrase
LLRKFTKASERAIVQLRGVLLHLIIDTASNVFSMNIHFQLRQQGASDPIIIMNVFDSRFEQRKFTYSTGISIDKNHWDKRRNRAKLILAKSKEYEELNKHLDQLQQTVIGYMSERHSANCLYRKDLKATLINSRTGQKHETLVDRTDYFFETWEKIIAESKTSKGESTTGDTKKQKRQTLKLVRKFSKERKVRPSFETIDMNFYHAFDKYMKDELLSGNSRGKHFKEIKALFREAMDRDIEVNLSFQKKSFKVIRIPTDSTYLNIQELIKISIVPLPVNLQAHRDIFLMACFVGVRHSDWNQISQSNCVIENGKELLKIKQTKTVDIIHIPVHPLVNEILNKYKGELPKVISNQKFNEALKEISKMADLGMVSINGQSVEKWTEITTHTARRSFATNAYLSKSLEVYQIMKCTGHKTEASFLAYLKLNGKDYALQAAESDFFKNTSWSNHLLVA